MSKTQQIADAIIAQGILPLYFNSSEEVSLDVLRSIYRAGIKAVEYTNRGDAALANFKKMVALRNNEMPGLLLGVGTIKNMQHATDYMNACNTTTFNVPNGAWGYQVAHSGNGYMSTVTMAPQVSVDYRENIYTLQKLP